MLPFNKANFFTLSLKLITVGQFFGLEYYPNFYLAFWEAYFPKIKGKESLSR
jgi:hypothetical protein